MLTDAAFADFYAAQSERFFCYPPTLIDSAMPDLFRQLNDTGRQIAIVSNTGFVNGREMRTALSLAGLPLERMSVGVFSDEVGINKPHRAIFEHLAEVAGVPAAHILHIGDNKRADYDGALAAGFQAAHISEQPTTSDVIRLVIGEDK
jgi:putative hydrolase of the HAD superfamily